MVKTRRSVIGRRKGEARASLNKRIPAEGASWPLCYKASHKINAINGEIGVELLANGTSLLGRKGDVSKGVITLISTAETMANELALYRLNGLDDVMGAGICHVLLSLLRGCSINEKLTLATIAGVSAENGIGGHWS